MTSDDLTRENVAKRLHEMANQLSAYNDGDTKALVDDLAAAVLFLRSDAKTLAAAQEENKRLREALENIRDLKFCKMPYDPHSDDVNTVSDYARAALGKGGSDEV